MEAFLHDLSWVLPLRNDTLTQVFNGFTFLGYLPFFLIFLPMGYWLGDKGVFTRLTMLVAIVALSNSFLKDLFQDPRPDLKFAIDQRVGDSFGFPSGHAQIAVAVWFWLALEIRRRWMWAIASFVATGVCLSRLYLGVHDIEDVLGGALLGLATIVIFAGLMSPSFEALRKLNPRMYLVAMLALVPVLSWLWPRVPVSDAVLAITSMMFFWYLGDTIQQTFISYKRHSNWAVAIVASIVAVAIMFVGFSFGGKLLANLGLEKNVISAIQLAYMALFSTLLVPAIFRATGLSGVPAKP